MNKQLRQLASQAGLDIYGLGAKRVPWEATLEQFSQLIVAECIEQVRGQFAPVLEDTEMMKDTHWDGYVQGCADSVVAIREHFYGVKE